MSKKKNQGKIFLIWDYSSLPELHQNIIPKEELFLLLLSQP